MTTEHILLTSLGVRPLETKYQWGERTVTASFTPLALVQLLEESQRPNRVVAVVTQEAKVKTWPLFKEGIHQKLGFMPKEIDIPAGNSSDEIRQILESVAARVPEGADLTLDVTQGLRHFPFIFYALALYLKSLRNVKIRGAYYGMIEGLSKDAPKPIIDLQPLLNLPEWFYAVRMFRDLGTTSPIAGLLQPLAEAPQQERIRAGKTGQERRHNTRQVDKAVNALKDQAFAYESALPLELGKASRLLIEPIKALGTMGFDDLPPLAEELTKDIASVAKKSALADNLERLERARGQWKTRVLLDEAELERQAQMIDLYFKRDQLSLAIGLMREWVISWVILKSGETDGWLKFDKRQRWERRLGALRVSARDRDPASNDIKDQQKIGTFWKQLTEGLRNALHHHAMREKALEKPPSSLKEIRQFWKQLKADKINLPELEGGGGRLLLSPQGTKPGVLFSALKVAQPDTCLVICSAASKSSIGEACEHAGFQGSIERIVLADPHGAFDKIKAFVEQARCHLLATGEVVANVTGGTTLMGLIIQELAKEAQKRDRPVRRFALIDRRPPAEQDRDPFVQGEHHWIDDPLTK